MQTEREKKTFVLNEKDWMASLFVLKNRNKTLKKDIKIKKKGYWITFK